MDNGGKVLICDPLVEPLALAALKDFPEGVTPPSVLVTGPSSAGHPNIMEVILDSSKPFGKVEEVIICYVKLKYSQ